MPAAAVIPAPVAYAKVVAVEKLVAEVWGWMAGSALFGVCTSYFLLFLPDLLLPAFAGRGYYGAPDLSL